MTIETTEKVVRIVAAAITIVWYLIQIWAYFHGIS
jgi:hypothetical protein